MRKADCPNGGVAELEFDTLTLGKTEIHTIPNVCKYCRATAILGLIASSQLQQTDPMRVEVIEIGRKNRVTHCERLQPEIINLIYESLT